ncbi:RasGEF domain-containing protein [Aphelenchoides avenae]|nr:RasGEF domain-containing protein [Aphelenchus avenae]
MQQLQHCRKQWQELVTRLFVDRIYTICQQKYPGMGIEQDAVRHISEILTRVLFEILEQKPENGRDMIAKMKNAFPTALTNFHHEAKGDLKRLYQGARKSKEAKTFADLHRRLHEAAKEHLGRKLDDDTIFSVMNVLEYILDDIINWAGIYATKLMEDANTITLPSLKSSLNADRGLAELMEILFNEEEASTVGVLHQATGIYAGRMQPRSNSQNSESICRNFRDDEMQFVRDLSMIMYVFKHRLEARLSKDALGRVDPHIKSGGHSGFPFQQYLQSIFGNVHEIHELAIKIHRTVEDAIDMSDPPCMGMGLAEFVEGREFDVYVEFMEIFGDPLNVKLARLLKEPDYQQFFDNEDRQCISTPDGQTFRMAVKYVLPSLLHSVVLHFKTYLKYIEDLINTSESEADKIDLKNVEFYLKTDVANTIKSLKLPPNPHIEKPAQLRRNKPDQLSNIQRVQRSIDGWVGEEIGFTCNEFIREGNLLKKSARSTISGASFGRAATPRHVFLFDHLLVICKEKNGKDKEKPFKYKDKLSIRKSDIVDLEDSEEMKNAFEVRSSGKNGEQTTITFISSTPEEKEDWMTSLVERQTAGVLHRMHEMYLKEEEKRIPLMIPTQSEYRFAEPDNDDNIVFEDYTHNSGIPVVRSGTIIKLVERLTYPQYTDNEFVKTFMTTYRSFCKPSDLLSLLIERFNVPVPQVFADQQLTGIPATPYPYKSGGPLAGRFDTVQSHGLSHFNQLSQTQLEQAYHRFRQEYQKPIQFKVLRILNHWVSHHFYDFEMDPELLEKLVTFLRGNDRSVMLITSQKKWCSKILEVIKKKQTANGEASPGAGPTERGVDCPETPNEGSLAPPSSYTPEMPEILWHYAKKGEIASYDLLTLHPLEIGRQITLLEFCLYRAIKPIELVDAAWMDKKDKYRKSPQLLKYVKHTDSLTYWVTRSLVETESLEERVAMFARVLEIMVVFEELNNFNGVVAFYSALAHSAIFRLKESQKRLDKEKKDWYDRFVKLCSDKRWNDVVQRLHSINPPCVPFAGMYMTQITFFKASKSISKADEEAAHERDNEAPHAHKRISFTHCRKIAAIIREIQMYQNQPYMLRVEPSIRQFFESLNPLQGFKDTDDLETYLYEQSVKIEPKDGSAAAVKPKRPPEALKSPGIKAAKAATPSTFQRSRSHNSNHHNHAGTLSKAPKSPPTASSGSSGRQSNVTSPSVPSSQPTPNTAKTFTSNKA